MVKVKGGKVMPQHPLMVILQQCLIKERKKERKNLESPRIALVFL